ncbi:class I poly(R)-hydroxyalkanoic acid synthase [Massilia sp. S19_KUP03_FR1]|uniref:class I poly(R)-hydroxyalkanoic acid synthase n=1 Tax=Massilia sp. S19_KUP03_FR1 TaxID=3025503 RepID=UPI002FCD749C
MNMPDPQAFLAAWMAQFSNPAAALAPAQVAGAIAPSKLEEIRNAYLKKATELWQSAMLGNLPVVQDKQFATPAWQDNVMSSFSAASYLLNAEFLTAMADAVEAPAREKQKIRFAVQQMVDAMSPANFLATNPEAQQQLIDSKGDSLTRGMANMLKDLQKGRISQSDESAFQVGENVATTPGTVVFQNDLFQLIQYTPVTPTVHAVPLLMIPPCINKYYILDLQPDNSLVRYMVEQGNTVFMVSWRNPDQSLAHTTWDDYVEQGAIRAIDVTRAISGQDKLNIFGFCVGGTIAASALAVLAARGQQAAASLTLLTTLLDYSDTGVLDVFIDEQQVALRESMLAKGGLMPGRDLATTFSSLRPNDLMWNYVQSNYLQGKEPPAFDLLYWNADSTNLPGPMFCFYLRNMYLENNLRIPGKLTVAGAKVDLGAIDAPVFIYGSKEDHIVPWDAAFRSLSLLNPTKPENNTFVLGASGHIAGVINPATKKKRSHWLRDGAAASAAQWMEGAGEQAGSWWPAWSDFLKKHGGTEVAAPVVAGNADYQPGEPAPGSYVKARAD